MSLKDRLTEALDTTADSHRKDTLRAALNAGDSDSDIAAALTRLIEAREQKATTFEKSGQPDLAKSERDEVAALRLLLRDPAAVAAGKSAAAKPGKSSPLFTRMQMIVGGVALVMAAVAALVVFNPFGSSDENAAPPTGKETVFKDDHTMGNPNATITLVEYAAPMCPHCAHFEKEEFPTLKRQYIDTGKVFYIFRVFPIGPLDGAVEGIARCLSADKYFPYMEMMFRSQPSWDPDGNQIADPVGAIANLATQFGLSPERAKQCMTDQAQMDRINQVAQDAQLRYQIDGTPTFVMNGQVVNMPPGQNAIDVLQLRINSLLGGQKQ